MLIALAVGVEMQAELFFVDAPQRDLLIARLAFLALAGAVLIRRRAPVLAAALGGRRDRRASARSARRSTTTSSGRSS